MYGNIFIKRHLIETQRTFTEVGTSMAPLKALKGIKSLPWSNESHFVFLRLVIIKVLIT